MKRISLIIPCLNEEQAIPEFKKEVDRVFSEHLNGYERELIFVDDGSTDHTLQTIKESGGSHRNKIHLLSSRNFERRRPSTLTGKPLRAIMPPVMDVEPAGPALPAPRTCSRPLRRKGTTAWHAPDHPEGEPALRPFFARAFYKNHQQDFRTRIRGRSPTTS